MSGDHERTDAGEQRLVPGVSPVRLRDRLAVKIAQPLRPKRNPHAEQKSCDHGLFDQEARAQIDIMDLINNKEA